MFSFKKILKYVWPSMRKHRHLFFGIFIVLGIRILAVDVIRPLYFKQIIDTLSNSGADRTIFEGRLMELLLICVVLIFISMAGARVGKLLHIDFEVKVIQDLRNFAFKRIERQSQTFFGNTFAGSLVTKSRRFVNSFEAMFDILVYDFWSIFVSLIGIFVVLIGAAPVISLVFIAWIIVYVVILSLFIKKKIRYDMAEAAADSKISGRLADIFGNILAVKTFAAKKKEIAMFGAITEEAAKKSRKAWFYGGRLEIVQAIIIAIVQSVVLYILIRLWLRDEITTGTVVLIQTYMVVMLDRLWSFGNALTRFMKQAADMQEAIEIFDVRPDILDPENPERSQMTNGHLVFENVSFSYPNGREILSDFNLDIKPGERLGLVGHSGAGKSTITKLLLRFTDITKGSITIDGQDIRNVTQDDLRSAVSYVPQEPVLFHRSIRENIAYGNPDASIEEIERAAKRAHAHEFISRLSDGYDTLVGERGVKLSGGERQRIAIARAILKNAPVLVLDEATSSLDSVSETLIQEAFSELMKGKTTIVIAHRLSTIQKMDRIIVLEDGAIVEEGTHKELLSKKGVYAELWNHQSGGFIE